MDIFPNVPSFVCHLRGRSGGPRVVILGGTHGDETTGVEVVRIILDRLGLDSSVPNGTHESAFVRGDLFLGIGNPEAVAGGTRSVSGIRDLNRCFHEVFFASEKEMQLPDQKRAAQLKDLLASADYLIDLHSVSAERSTPFVGLTTFSKKHAHLCSFIPVRYILNVHAILGQDIGLVLPSLEQTPTTCSWVNRYGGAGLAYEMGSQKDPTSVLRALQTLLFILKGIGSIDERFLETIGVTIDLSLTDVSRQVVYRLVTCERNLFKGFTFAHDRYTESWLPVQAGELIGCYQDGEEVRVHQTGRLIFIAGKHTLDTNPSLFYLAVPEDNCT